MNPSMHALTLYLDTSVIGGYFDAEFMTATRAYPPVRIVAPTFLIHGHEDQDL